MEACWDYRANKNWAKHDKKGFIITSKVPLGVLAGGCCNCGHLCSFDEKKMKCSKCGWKWQDELKNIK